MTSASTVCIRRLARFYCAADWSWEVRGRSRWTGEGDEAVLFNYDLWTVLQGKGVMDAPAGRFEIQTGDCFVLRGDASYRVRHDPSDPLVVFAVHFDFLDEQGAVVYPDVPFHRQIRNLDFLAHLFERVERAWQEEDEDAAFWLSACLKEIGRQDREAAEHGFRRRQADLIRKLCGEIRREPGGVYRVEELAARLNCSRFHFSRIFKETTGHSPTDFIVNTRIEAAKGMLHSSGYSINRIAELLGYQDVCFFSRQFKSRTGLSPIKYRS